jgi:outer membrane protein N
MNVGRVRWVRCLVLVVSVLTLLASQGFGEETSEIEELRALLATLEARVAVLEDGGDPERAAEIAEIRALLATAETRLAGLDEPVASPAEAEVSDPQPSEQPLFSRFEREFYGSLRVRTLVAEGGDIEFIDRFSRIGFYGRYPGGERWSVLGRIEAGVNLVNQNPTIDVGGDPGFAFGEGSQAFTTRLGYVGFETPVGDVTWGKQWAVYYDVAEWTDQFYTFGGDGAGAYALGDGGINGTGRAETAAQYRNEWGPLQLGLQVQNRKRTDNDRDFADTFGASLRLSASDSLEFGLAYNEVKDGVEDPGPNEPHIGDTATLVGARWDRGPLLLVVTLARGEQRNQDDEDTWFDSLGGEAFGQWSFDKHWSLFGGVNWLEPDDDDVHTEYRILDYFVGTAYRLNPYVVISGELRLAESRTAEGEPLRADTFAFGVDLGW